MKAKFLTLLLTTIIFTFSYSQNFENSVICSLSKIEYEQSCSNSLYSEIDFSVNDYGLKKIFDKISLASGTFLNYKVYQCDGLFNAKACSDYIIKVDDNNKPYIAGTDKYFVIDKNFIYRLGNDKNKWISYGIFSHEWAHIINNHTTAVDNTFTARGQQEMQADFYAGYLLQILGASKEESTMFMKALPVSDNKSYYGTPEQRINYIINGYDTAKVNHQNHSDINNSDFNSILKEGDLLKYVEPITSDFDYLENLNITAENQRAIEVIIGKAKRDKNEITDYFSVFDLNNIIYNDSKNLKKFNNKKISVFGYLFYTEKNYGGNFNLVIVQPIGFKLGLPVLDATSKFKIFIDDISIIELLKNSRKGDWVQISGRVKTLTNELYFSNPDIKTLRKNIPQPKIISKF